MANSYVQVAPNGGGAKIDTSELTVLGITVERQNIVIADPVNALNVSQVLNSAPAGTEYALVVRPIPSGTQTITGIVTAQGASPNGGLATGSPSLGAGSDGTYTRTLLTDLNGSQTMVGSPYYATPVAVTGAPSSLAGDGLIDVLNNMLRELKQLNFFIKQLPLYLNTGNNISDEDAVFRDDPTLFQ